LQRDLKMRESLLGYIIFLIKINYCSIRNLIHLELSGI
jgi:hypothetical protein